MEPLRQQIVSNIEITARNDGELYPEMKRAQKACLQMVYSGAGLPACAAPFMQIALKVARRETMQFGMPEANGREIRAAAGLLATYVNENPDEFLWLLEE